MISSNSKSDVNTADDSAFDVVMTDTTVSPDNDSIEDQTLVQSPNYVK